MSNAENNYEGGHLLLEIDANLENYSNYIVSAFIRISNLSGISSPHVLDFGAGYGTLAKIWKAKTANPPDCVEIDLEMSSQLVKMGFRTATHVNQLNSEYDFIYTSNVLEHIEDDVEALRDLKNSLKPSGLLGVYVPAFGILFSDLDRAVGHHRRYRRNNIIEKLEEAGFRILFCHYSDSLGFLSAGILKLMKVSVVNRMSSKFLMKFYDIVMLPLSIFFDRIGFKYLFGKNIILAATPLDQEHS